MKEEIVIRSLFTLVIACMVVMIACAFMINIERNHIASQSKAAYTACIAEGGESIKVVTPTGLIEGCRP